MAIDRHTITMVKSVLFSRIATGYMRRPNGMYKYNDVLLQAARIPYNVAIRISLVLVNCAPLHAQVLLRLPQPHARRRPALATSLAVSDSKERQMRGSRREQRLVRRALGSHPACVPTRVCATRRMRRHRTSLDTSRWISPLRASQGTHRLIATHDGRHLLGEASFRFHPPRCGSAFSSRDSESTAAA